MTLADTVASASVHGTFTVGGGAAYPVLRLDESVSVRGDEGGNGRHVIVRRMVINSLTHASGESPANVGAAREALVSALAKRGAAVTVTQRGGAARTFRAGGDVAGISDGGVTTVPGFPAVSIAFAPEGSPGAAVFFTANVDVEEIVFAAAASGYNGALVTTRVEKTTDRAGLVSVRTRGSVALKPGQDAMAYVEAVIFTPAAAAAAGDGNDFTGSVRHVSGDGSRCEYEHSATPPSFGFGGFTTATTVDETDVTRSTVEGRTVRTISGRVTGPGAYAAAEGRKPSTPDNHVLVSESISQPGTLGGAVSYAYEYLTGRPGAGELSGTVFFGFRQAVDRSGGRRRMLVGEFDNAPPVIGFGTLPAVVYVESTDCEFIGATPDIDDLPRGTGLDADDEADAQAFGLVASAPGMGALRLVRVYVRDEMYAVPPTPADPPFAS